MQTKVRVFVDYATTTPFNNQVPEATLPDGQQNFRTQSSILPAKIALARSREIVSDALPCSPPSTLSPLHSVSKSQ